MHMNISGRYGSFWSNRGGRALNPFPYAQQANLPRPTPKPATPVPQHLDHHTPKPAKKKPVQHSEYHVVKEPIAHKTEHQGYHSNEPVHHHSGEDSHYQIVHPNR